jgi:hypothetical protein
MQFINFVLKIHVLQNDIILTSLLILSFGAVNMKSLAFLSTGFIVNCKHKIQLLLIQIIK